ncbi:MFS transporter [Prochlorococcus sp. MIT 1300]|uniref:MFS transporter n=1 Tax=Prochlorococcus sp. MIT 1300 TaxID=3096218 RepID=UPI002A7584E5|nr:MFS transporter [Prochlorococcus sp. MIT 1300]
MRWWNQFPSSLRFIASTRLLASLGTGGVIYFTALVFKQLAFSATEIGTGFAAAAITGSIARILSGKLVDKTEDCLSPVIWAASVAILADITLLRGYSFNSYLLGQLLLGTAAGLYWPAIEVAVPISCKTYPSNKGFALVRSADALGISLGALMGTTFAWLNILRAIYIFDTFCMFLLLLLMRKNRSLIGRKADKLMTLRENSLASYEPREDHTKWIKPLIPILVISLISTLIFSLLQSALPIDLRNGSLDRLALDNRWTGGIIAIQLFLLVIFQWPLGEWLSRRTTGFGLKLSLSLLACGSLLIGFSGFSSNGWLIVLLAQIPIALGLAAFLPTATESIIQQTPANKRGIGMALFSQCFAISAIIAPIAGGRLLDSQGNGVLLWTITAIACCLAIPLETTNKKD